MLTNDDLERASQLADERLGVAEELGWPMALFAGAAAHLAWSSWALTLLVVPLTYYCATFSYRRQSHRAEDAYYRAARLGKYASKAPSSDDDHDIKGAQGASCLITGRPTTGNYA
jgi:hypothetical protein